MTEEEYQILKFYNSKKSKEFTFDDLIQLRIKKPSLNICYDGEGYSEYSTDYVKIIDGLNRAGFLGYLAKDGRLIKGQVDLIIHHASSVKYIITKKGIAARRKHFWNKINSVAKGVPAWVNLIFALATTIVLITQTVISNNQQKKGDIIEVQLKELQLQYKQMSKGLQELKDKEKSKLPVRLTQPLDEKPSKDSTINK